jgi:hypothetical protein
MKRILALFVFAVLLTAQSTPLRWAATTGNVSLSGAGTTATIQQPNTTGNDILIDQIVVYCSVACIVTQAANGSAATATVGTVTPILPTPLQVSVPVGFFTASNVGSGTAQGGAVNLPAGATQVFCLSPACGNPAQVAVSRGSVNNNYSVAVSTITGTANITFYGRSQ